MNCDCYNCPHKHRNKGRSEEHHSRSDSRYIPIVDTSTLYNDLNHAEKFKILGTFGICENKHRGKSLIYKTVNGEYGQYIPCVHTISERYYPKITNFTDHLARCGMYRDYSLNCALDKTFV